MSEVIYPFFEGGGLLKESHGPVSVERPTL